jgi:hypothetical protein
MAGRRLNLGAARRGWAIVGLLVLSLGWSTARAADGGIVILTNTYSYAFGRTITFHLEASSSAEITQVQLTYGPAGRSGEAITVQVDLTPGTHVVTDYSYDLTTRHVQAFSQIEYYWIVTDAHQQHLPTAPVRFEYADDRFQWQKLDEAGVTVAWYGGARDTGFGRMAVFDAQRARSKIAAVTGGNPEQAFRVYIYSTATDLQTAAQVNQQEWIVGQAYPRTATCLVLIPDGPDFAKEMERVVPHEITHLLIGDLAVRMPRWLDEGLATENEGVHDPVAQTALDEAAVTGALLPFGSLCAQFPADPHQAALAYAQSGSLVAFLRERYGQEGLRRLVAAYGAAPDCESGLRSALGLTLEQVQADWESTQRRPADMGRALQVGAPWLALCMGGGLVVLLALPSISPWVGRRHIAASSNEAGVQADQVTGAVAGKPREGSSKLVQASDVIA